MKELAKDTYQQGDVIFRRVGEALSPGHDKNVVARGRCVVAEGEGHHVHVIDAPVESDAELIKEGGRMLLNLQHMQEVQHQHTSGGLSGDHNTYTLGPGLWEVGGVREVDHFAQLERRVMD
jgi:hypothetical protein